MFLSWSHPKYLWINIFLPSVFCDWTTKPYFTVISPSFATLPLPFCSSNTACTSIAWSFSAQPKLPFKAPFSPSPLASFSPPSPDSTFQALISFFYASPPTPSFWCLTPHLSWVFSEQFAAEEAEWWLIDHWNVILLAFNFPQISQVLTSPFALVESIPLAFVYWGQIPLSFI